MNSNLSFLIEPFADRCSLRITSYSLSFAVEIKNNISTCIDPIITSRRRKIIWEVSGPYEVLIREHRSVQNLISSLRRSFLLFIPWNVLKKETSALREREGREGNFCVFTQKFPSFNNLKCIKEGNFCVKKKMRL